MSLNIGILSVGTGVVPVYTRVLPGNGPVTDTKQSGKHNRSKAHTKMGVGTGPTREQIMKAFARNKPDSWYYTDYSLWWDSLRNPKMASEFMGDLIYFCIALHDSKQKKLRKSWFDKAGKLSQNDSFALVRRAGKTIHYITCCYKVIQTTHLTQAIGDWYDAQKVLVDSREKNGVTGHSTVIDSPVILHSILLLERTLERVESDRNYWSKCIVPRVIECTFVGPEDAAVGQSSDGTLATESSKSSSSSGGSGESELDPDIAYCFSSCGDYPHVLTLLHEIMRWSFPSDPAATLATPATSAPTLSGDGGTSGAFIVYETMGKLLKRLPSKMRINPTVARNTLLSIIHLFQRMLERHPILDFDFVVSVHETLVPYLRWAAPYCTAVSGLLQVLEAEACSPGTSLRQWHGRCRPLLGSHGRALRRQLSNNNNNNGKKDDEAAEGARLWHRLGSSMILHYDGGSPLACTYARVALMTAAESTQAMEHDIVRMQRALITESIDSEFEIIKQRTVTAAQANEGDHTEVDDVYINGKDYDPLSLNTATPQQIQKWYDVCSSVMAHDFGRNVGTCQEWRADDAFAVKRCRRSALSKLVKLIDTALQSNVRLLTVRDDEQNSNNKKSTNSSSSTTIPTTTTNSKISMDSAHFFTDNSDASSTGAPVGGRSSFGHALPFIDPKLCLVPREYSHLSNTQPSAVVLPPTLTPDERLLGFDDESRLMMSTIDAFVQGCAAAMRASRGENYTTRQTEADVTGGGASTKAYQTRREENEEDTEQPLLRLCAMGNGTSFHQFVLSYVCAVSQLRGSWSEAETAANTEGEEEEDDEVASKWDVLRSLLDRAVRIYIVPIGRNGNDLASWLAHRDGWYRRTVYSTFRAQPDYVPALHMPRGPSMKDAIDLLRLDNQTKQIVHDDSQPPLCSTIPATLMDYGMNARTVYPVTLFRCECWTTQTTSVPAGYGEKSIRLPFSDVSGASYTGENRRRSTSTGSNSSGSSRPKSNRIRGTGAPLVVPFATRVEIGLSTILREYMDEMDNDNAGGSNETKTTPKDGNKTTPSVGTDQNSISYDTWREETLQSKEFHAWWNKKEASFSSSSSSSSNANSTNASSNTPYLSIKFTENDMNGEVLPLSQEQALITNQYIHISISNCFRYTNPTSTSDTTCIDGMVPCSPGTNPLDNSVGLRCVPSSPQLTDMLKKKKWNAADVSTFKDTLCNTSMQHHAGIVEVSSLDPKNGFSVLLDGALYGPFSKIRISPCTDRSGVPISMPMAGFT